MRSLFLAVVLGAVPMVRSDVPAELTGRHVPDSVKKNLVVLDVTYRNFKGREQAGRVVCHALAAADLRGLFDTLFKAGYPLSSVRPVAEFGFSDSLSMLADNSSAFNWRTVKGTSRLSTHAQGLAIDIAPLRNPFEHRRGTRPAGAKHDRHVPGTLFDTSLAVRYLRARGWQWGGRWASGRDWQHFELPLPRAIAKGRGKSAVAERKP